MARDQSARDAARFPIFKIRKLRVGVGAGRDLNHIPLDNASVALPTELAAPFICLQFFHVYLRSIGSRTTLLVITGDLDYT